MARRGATTLSGILPIDKPTGLTSHDVVARLRRVTGEKRIGHAGTLDPAATGLLVALIGPATRLEPYLSAARKSYLATIAFGHSTDTDDAEGQTVASGIPAAEVFDPRRAAEVLGSFLGSSMQMPPRYSAIKVGGRTAHRVARAGGEIELEPRGIEVYEATLLGTDSAAATWDVRFCVSKGTYIRSLARDIGEAVGCPAHLAALRRTGSGQLTVDEATSLADAIEIIGAQPGDVAGTLAPLLADPLRALGEPPTTVAPAAHILAGRSIPAPAGVGEGELLAVLDEAGALAALYRVAEGAARPEVVLAVPIRRDL